MKYIYWTNLGHGLHVANELFEACIIDEIFLEFVEDIKRISENNKANSTNDSVTKVWGNILTKEIITKSVVPDLLKNIDLKQIKILDYAQELCPPDVKGQVYVSESEIMNDRNKTYYKILEHPLYGRMADTGIIGVLTHDGYMEFVVPNCESLLNKNTILFVHGAYHAAWCWEEHFIPFFYAHGYNVYAMSFRNHGNSERIENVDQIVVKDMVEDLIKTIDIIDGKIILIAHSLGCRIAQMCLEEIYSSIQSVVLITPMPVRNNFLQLLQMSKKQRKNNLEYILFSERLDSEQKEYYMSLLDKESKKVEYAMMKRQKKFSIYVRKIPTLVIGSYNDQCVILQAVKDNAKIHTAELKIVDSVCHDMMLDPDWRNIADLIFKFIEKTIDKKSGDNYNDNYVSTQAHQGGE